MGQSSGGAHKLGLIHVRELIWLKCGVKDPITRLTLPVARFRLCAFNLI
jgi:hypothetical protein